MLLPPPPHRRLADHVRPDLRPSLLLSILQQLSEDPDPMVREAVAANLARIVGKIAGLDKFAQVQEIMMGAPGGAGGRGDGGSD